MIATTTDRSGGWLVSAIFIATFLVTAFLIVTPLGALLHGSFQTGGPGTKSEFTWQNWLDLGSGNIIHTLLITCFISVVTAVFSTLGGAMLTWLVYRTDFRFKNSLVAAVGLSFFFPGFILAMAWVILASPGGIFNELLEDILGLEWMHFDIYSVWGIIWIQVLHIVPFAFFTLRGPMITMDSSLEEAGYASGANPWAVIRRVTLPLMIFPLMSSLLLCFVLSVEQFAIPAMVGIPGHEHAGDRTLSADQLFTAKHWPRRGGWARDERRDRADHFRAASDRPPQRRANRDGARISGAAAHFGPVAYRGARSLPVLRGDELHHSGAGTDIHLRY
jgi:ABC-type Fe3+ transport system permease subunit